MRTSKTSNASAALWANAHRRIDAENGMGDPADAMGPYVPSISVEIAVLNHDPGALGRLAARADLTDAQRVEILKKYKPSEPPAAKKAQAKPPAPSRLSRTLAGIRLFGKSGTGAGS